MAGNCRRGNVGETIGTAQWATSENETKFEYGEGRISGTTIFRNFYRLSMRIPTCIEP